MDYVRAYVAGFLATLLFHQLLLGLLYVAGIVPVAPFGLINMACGASHIRFRDYVAGSFLGMGVMTVALSGGTAVVRAAAVRPSIASIAVAGVVLLTAGLILFTLHRRLGGPRPA